MGCCFARLCRGRNDGLKDEGSAEGELPRMLMNKTERKCTDVLVLLLFIASFGGIAWILGECLARGSDPNRLIRGVDYDNRVCGKSDGVTDEPYAAWPYTEFDLLDPSLLTSMYHIKVCLPSCEDTQTSSLMVHPHVSTKVYYYCLPSFNSTAAETAFNLLLEDNQGADILVRVAGDVYTTYPLLLGAIPISMAFSFAFILIAVYWAGALVWFSILSVVGGALILSYMLLHYDPPSFGTLSEDDAKASVEFAGWVVFALAEIALIAIVMLRTRIQVAVEVVKEASKAVLNNLWMFLVPVFFFLFGLVYLGFWVYVALNIFSVRVDDEIVELPSDLAAVLGTTTYTDTDWDTSIRGYAAYHLFHLLWMVQFFIYGAYMTICGSLADWFFSDVDAKGERIRGKGDAEFDSNPVWASFYRMVRYNLGTVAFAALLIAIVQFIRAMVEFLEENSIDEKNALQKTLFRIVKCILWCLECCIDKMNENALVYCCIYNKPLCESACKQFAITFRNLGRVAALTIVSAFLLILGKLSVSSIVAGIVTYAIRNSDEDWADVSSLLTPAILAFIIAYLTASLLFVVYQGAIDTIFFCFLVDFENNKDGQMFSSQSLIDLVCDHEAASAQQASRNLRWKNAHENDVPGEDVNLLKHKSEKNLDVEMQNK